MMTMEHESYSHLMHNTLSLKLKEVHASKLLLIDMLKDDAYCYEEGHFTKKILKDTGISQETLSEIQTPIYISHEDFKIIQEKLSDRLLTLTRSLSIGNPLKNGAKHASLLTMQLSNLYDDPYDDELLTSHFQSSKNLSTLLYNNKKIQKSLYHYLKKQNYHFAHTQPLLSSILLLAFIQHTNMFNEKEAHNLFLTSYFKDIGMSFIPREKLEVAHLSENDKKIFAEHAKFSLSLLEGRVPISRTHLNLIANHHFLNYVIQSKATNRPLPPEAEILTGVESVLLSAIDILVAMTTERPYRKKVSVYRALELLKKVIADDYPQEFRKLVIFIRQFLGT